MKKRKLKKQSFMQGVLVLMLSQMVIKVLGLVYKLYLTNKEGFGDKGNAISGGAFQIYAFFLTLSSIGVPNAVSKLVSEKVAVGDHRGAHRIFKIAFVTFGLVGFICSSILFCSAGIISNEFLQIPEAEQSLVALSPSIFFVAISAVIKGYFMGRENLKVVANSQTLEQVFKMALSVIIVEFLGITSGLDTTIMSAGANLATTFAITLCFAYLYQYYHSIKSEIALEIKTSVNYKQVRVRKTLKRILFVSIPMSLTAILGVLNKNIDSMTVVRGLKKFLSEEHAKIQYGILSGKVDTLVTMPMSLNIAFATALIPAISSAQATGDVQTAKKKISFSILMAILVGLPFSVGMIIFAKPILELLFPNATSGSFVYQISSLGITFILLEQTMSSALHGMGKMISPACCLGVGVIVKLILNLILIPIDNTKFIFGGVVGAALATVVCHIISSTLQLRVLKKNINLSFRISKILVKPIIATIFMAMGSYLVYFLFFSIIHEKIATLIALLSAVIIYTMCILFLRVFSKEELCMIPGGEKIYQIFHKMRIY